MRWAYSYSRHASFDYSLFVCLQSAGLLWDSVVLRGASSCRLQRAPFGKLLKLLWSASQFDISELAPAYTQSRDRHRLTASERGPRRSRSSPPARPRLTIAPVVAVEFLLAEPRGKISARERRLHRRY